MENSPSKTEACAACPEKDGDCDDSCTHQNAERYQDFCRFLAAIPAELPPLTPAMQSTLWQSCYNEVLMKEGQVCAQAFADPVVTARLLYQACLRLGGVFRRYLSVWRAAPAAS